MLNRAAATQFCALLLVLSPVAVYGQGQTLTASWDPNSQDDQVTGYTVCLGTSSLSCNVALATIPESQTSHAFTATSGVLYYFAVKALSGSAQSEYSTEISASIPSFTQLPNRNSPANVPIAPTDVAVNDPDGGTLQFSQTGLPPGLSIDPTTGQISGSPTVAGVYNVTVGVFDGLVMALGTFDWTIGDGTLPTVNITSHVSGQTVPASTVTMSGTATDAGTGDSGIASVAVNGQAASGGTATDNGTANWTRNLTLSSGTNVVTVVATDGSGNTGTASISLIGGSASSSGTPMTGASLTASLSSPQQLGGVITLGATGTGGKAPYSYKWYLQKDNGGFGILRYWDDDPVFPWTPTETGSYVIAIWARSHGATADQWEAYAERSFVITASTQSGNPTPETPATLPVTGASLVASLSSPQELGAFIMLTAGATGGTAPYSYKWYLRRDNGEFGILRYWDDDPVFPWTPTQAGSYAIAIWVRSHGATADHWEAYAERSFVITDPTQSANPPETPSIPPATGASLVASLSSPQELGSVVTLTASATGGAEPYSYKWYMRRDNGAWGILRDWDSDPEFPWTPTETGSYGIAIWARSDGATADQWQAYAERSFVIVAPTQSVNPTPEPVPGAPMTGASLSASLPSPQRTGTPVTFTASGTGGVGPYEYQWYVMRNGGQWRQLRTWSTTPTYEWTPTQGGTFTIAIWARSAGSTEDAWQVYATHPFVFRGAWQTPSTTTLSSTIQPETPGTPSTPTMAAFLRANHTDSPVTNWHDLELAWRGRRSTV